MTEVIERPAVTTAADTRDLALGNIAGQLEAAYKRGARDAAAFYQEGGDDDLTDAMTNTFMQGLTSRHVNGEPSDADGPVTADDITTMYREYTHMFIDALFDCLGLEDVGFGKRSGVIAFFEGAITPETYRDRLTAMINRWSDYVTSDMKEDCGGDGGCSYGDKCLIHNLPDLCVPFKVDADLRRIFDAIHRRGVWRYIGSDASDGIGYERYLNTMTGGIMFSRPRDYRDVPDNDLVTREGGL